MLYLYFEVVLGRSGLYSTLGLLPMAVLMMMMSEFRRAQPETSDAASP